METRCTSGWLAFAVVACLACAAFAAGAHAGGPSGDPVRTPVAPGTSGETAPPSPPAEAGPPGEVETLVQDELAVRGVVSAIDVAGRRLSLDTAAGMRVLPVDPAVIGLDRLRVGDVVDVRYHRSVLFDIQPAGSAEPGAYIAESGRGAGPGAIGEQEVTVLATVIEVDATAGAFTVLGPSGNVRTLHAETPGHRAAVARIRVGDLLRVRFREAVAVSLAQAELH